MKRLKDYALLNWAGLEGKRGIVVGDGGFNSHKGVAMMASQRWKGKGSERDYT